MITYRDFKRSSAFLLLIAIFAMALSTGCDSVPVKHVTVNCNCGSTQSYDVVYAFNIPTRQADCPANTTLNELEPDDVVDPQSGGGGVVERSGGGGVVDRQDNFIAAWCQPNCPTGQSADESANPTMEWNYDSDFLVASKPCN